MKTLFLALAAGTATGKILSPAPRTYASAIHAQLANPTGILYEVKLDEAADSLEVYAVADSLYPLDLIEVRIPGIGAQAEGAEVLRDMGTSKPHRWVCHFRNDQLGGYHQGDYFDTWEEAVARFAERAGKTFARTATMVARNVRHNEPA